MDPIANMLTIIINAQRVGKERVVIPYSTMVGRLAKFLQEEEVLAKIRVQGDKKKRLLITLKYENKKPVIREVKRMSKPGSRYYVRADEMPYSGNRPGFYVVSTSQGLMNQNKARAGNLGGELLCAVWRSK